MRTVRLVGLLFLIITWGCDKLDLKEDVPGCIEDKIKEFKDDPLTCNSGASVYRFNFQGKIVYVFGPGNCTPDNVAPVYDEECKLLCGLGGFIGNLECNGERFDVNATNKTLIWEN